MKDVMTTLGVEAKKDAAQAVRGDLGDQSMSGWWRGRPIGIAARFDHTGNGSITIEPEPRSRGPWKVLEDGRSSGMSRGRKGGKRQRVGGVLSTSNSSASRRVGATRAKSTWTDAGELIEERTPERALDALYDVARGIIVG